MANAVPAPAPLPTWRAVEAIPLFVVVQFGAILLALPLLAIADSCGATYVIGHLALRVSFVACTLLWVRLLSRGSLAALGATRATGRDAVQGAGVGAGLVVLGLLTVALTRIVASAVLGHPPPEAQQIDACVQGTTLALSAPLIILGAPIAEELFFRGFLYRGLRRRFSVWLAAAISSAAFALVHVNPESATEAAATALLAPGLFVVGVGLALVYERRQSLLAPISGHAVFNLVGFLAIVLSRT
jgi:membrane protease YdiL (CAAX protease family)